MKKIIRLLLDLLLPPRCLGCRDILADQRGLCAPCWTQIRFIDQPACALCGLPFEFASGGQDLCARCHARTPDFDGARSVFVYEGKGRDLVSAFKYGDRLDAVHLFAAWLARTDPPSLEATDFIMPVPLHWTRLFRRRFNQSAELARALGRLSGRRVAVDLLKRRRATPSQVGLSARARRRNVAGAFSLSGRARASLQGKRILLVDDVLTTGATLEACARLLKSMGVRSVHVLTLARVVSATDVTAR